MSIQMTAVFATMVAEMVVLFGLVLPLPHVVRKQIVAAEAVLKDNKNLKVLVVFATVLLLLQFVDSVQRLRKYTYLSNPYYTAAQDAPFRGSLTSEQLASKFYSQRNMYISGAVIYLELAIATVVPIVRKLVSKESEFRKLKASNTFALEDEEADKLRELIKRKEVDIQTLKKQVDGLQKAYDGLTESQPVNKSD